jgi:hypothetical protein
MRPKLPVPLEWEEQATLASLLTLARLTFFHIPNGEARSKAGAGRLKAMGVKAGAPDLFIADAPPARPDCRGVFIEMKRTRNSKGLSPEQKIMGEKLRERGYTVLTCKGWQAAAVALRSLGYDIPGG